MGSSHPCYPGLGADGQTTHRPTDNDARYKGIVARGPGPPQPRRAPDRFRTGPRCGERGNGWQQAMSERVHPPVDSCQRRRSTCSPLTFWGPHPASAHGCHGADPKEHQCDLHCAPRDMCRCRCVGGLLPSSQRGNTRVIPVLPGAAHPPPPDNSRQEALLIKSGPLFPTTHNRWIHATLKTCCMSSTTIWT